MKNELMRASRLISIVLIGECLGSEAAGTRRRRGKTSQMKHFVTNSKQLRGSFSSTCSVWKEHTRPYVGIVGGGDPDGSAKFLRPSDVAMKAEWGRRCTRVRGSARVGRAAFRVVALEGTPAVVQHCRTEVTWLFISEPCFGGIANQMFVRR